MDQYQAQVKLVDEFRARFNGTEKRNDIDQVPNPEQVQLQLLCDGERYIADSMFRSQCNHLIDTILAQKTRLQYSDSTWYATAMCQAKLMGKPFQLTLYLSVEPRGDDMYKWVIADVKADTMNLGGYGHIDQLFLMPNQHEMNFMALRRTTSETSQYIESFTKNSFSNNRLNVFATLVYLDLLKIESVSDLSFTFLQVDGYRFTIRYFVRQSRNSGWLISDIHKMTTQQKNEIIQLIH